MWFQVNKEEDDSECGIGVKKCDRWLALGSGFELISLLEVFVKTLQVGLSGVWDLLKFGVCSVI